MKAKTIFLTSITCTILLAAQIGKPPQAMPKPSPTETSIPEITECFISDFAPMDKGQADNEILHRAVTPTEEIEIPRTSVAAEKIVKISTQKEPFLEQPAEQAPPPQNNQTGTPKMGDTRVVNGQKQCYFLGFGWIDDNDEPNEYIYAEDMYENGNKIGSMGGGTLLDGDGDINKMVGTMD
ncbi:DUF6550 family protein [Hydrogenoanaerobacterium sp.]|uniref:DUF6550 family protein n=1 Tax=Hydrogenoanaerobacterium sp. TaxID=2953763 RepID=UPI00289B87BF|nr:DUF6550 family protein [Hydrogenoanaerobacterium sp.]